MNLTEIEEFWLGRLLAAGQGCQSDDGWTANIVSISHNCYLAGENSAPPTSDN